MNHRRERAIPVRSLPRVVRAGFDRHTRGAEPTQVVRQTLGTGLQLYEIEYVDEYGEEREAVLGCDGLPLSREEITQHGRRITS